MKLQNYSTEKLQLKIDELREELFARQMSGAAEFAKYNEDDSKWIFVEGVNTMMVQPDKKSYYIGIDDYNDQQITLVFPIESVAEIARHLSKKPNWDRIKLLTQEDLDELSSESFEELNDLPFTAKILPSPFPKEEVKSVSEKEFLNTVNDLIESGVTLANWSPESGENPIMYDLPSNLVYKPFQISEITAAQVKKHNEFITNNKFKVSVGLNHSVFNVSCLTNSRTFELLTIEDGDNLSEILTDVDKFEVIIDYPLERAVLVTFDKIVGSYGEHTYNANSIGYVLWQISQAYLEIYRNYENYGVYMHGLSDLHFEGIAVTPQGKCILYIGS